MPAKSPHTQPLSSHEIRSELRLRLDGDGEGTGRSRALDSGYCRSALSIEHRAQRALRERPARSGPVPKYSAHPATSLVPVPGGYGGRRRGDAWEKEQAGLGEMGTSLSPLRGSARLEGQHTTAGGEGARGYGHPYIAVRHRRTPSAQRLSSPFCDLSVHHSINGISSSVSVRQELRRAHGPTYMPRERRPRLEGERKGASPSPATSCLVSAPAAPLNASEPVMRVQTARRPSPRRVSASVLAMTRPLSFSSLRRPCVPPSVESSPESPLETRRNDQVTC